MLVAAVLSGGGRVFATDRSDEALASLGDLPGAGPSRLQCLAADLLQEDSARRVVQAAVRRFGAVTAFVSNAGVGRSLDTQDVLGRAPRVREVPAHAWSTMFGVNAMSAIRLSNAVIPELVQAPRARMIFVTTSLDSMLTAGMGPYGPSKAALEAYASVAADELRETGVTVNVRVPGGPVDTPMVPPTSGVSRERMLPAAVMIPPFEYLLSGQADGVTAMRFRANLWDASLPPAQAAQGCAAPIAWSGIARGQRRNPV